MRFGAAVATVAVLIALGWMMPAPLADIVAAVATGTAPRDAGRLHVDVGRLIVLTDPPILETVLRHLVDNALRFSPPASTVDITASVSEAEPGFVHVVVADGARVSTSGSSHARSTPSRS
jgi:signal transduction histidine kinase